jgi:hypothetical protein
LQLHSHTHTYTYARTHARARAFGIITLTTYRSEEIGEQIQQLHASERAEKGDVSIGEHAFQIGQLVTHWLGGGESIRFHDQLALPEAHVQQAALLIRGNTHQHTDKHTDEQEQKGDGKKYQVNTTTTAQHATAQLPTPHKNHTFRRVLKKSAVGGALAVCSVASAANRHHLAGSDAGVDPAGRSLKLRARASTMEG